MYNVSDYIERCIESVTRQTYSCLECIIVDDGSVDDSVKKCERIINAYKGQIQFSILHHECNRGPSAARNTGTDAVTGQYLYYLDSDDYITDDCIEKLLAPVMEDESIEVVQGKSHLVVKGKTHVSSKQKMTHPVDLIGNELIQDMFFIRRQWVSVYITNELIKISFIRDNHIRFKESLLWEDVLWFSNVINKVSHMYIIPDKTYYYCKRPHSITTGTQTSTMVLNSGIVYDEIAGNFTPGHGGKEAKYLYKAFLNNYAHNTEYKKYYSTAKKYRNALADGHYYKEMVIFAIVAFLLRFNMLRALFRFLEKYLRGGK